MVDLIAEYQQYQDANQYLPTQAQSNVVDLIAEYQQYQDARVEEDGEDEYSEEYEE